MDNVSTTTDIKPSLDEGASCSDKTEKTEKPYAPPNFWHGLNHKTVSARLINGQQIQGVLKGYNPFDLLIVLADKSEIIVPKHAVLFIGAVQVTQTKPLEKPGKKEFQVRRTGY